MAENAPIRPQRIIRANRETTGGLLMSVIRSLTTSRDSADRDRERLELEKGFQQCDSKLNELITQHSNDLYQVMNTFSKILSNLSRAKERLIDTRDKLLNCQKLLHCKRDELKKLWLEIVENRAVYDLLERIEQIALLPRQVEAYIEKKYYLHAGQCCEVGLRQLDQRFYHDRLNVHFGAEQNGLPIDLNMHTINQMEQCSSLSKIEALSEVRSELLAKKETLFEKCIDELHRHLYSVATEDIRKRFQHKQQQQYRIKAENNDLITLNQKPSTIYENIYPHDLEKNDHEISMVEWSLLNTSDRQSSTIHSSHFESYPEEDSRQFISMLSKCIGLLNKIPSAVKIIKERFDEEFVNLVIRTAQDILSLNDSLGMENGASNSHESSPIFTITPASFIDSDGLDESSLSTLSNGQISGQDLIVLTCTRLLGYRYNGFSHLEKKNEVIHERQLPRTSIQLKQLFDMLMKQFFYIIQLHQSIVLANLKRIEFGLHFTSSISFPDPSTGKDHIDLDDKQPNNSTVFYSPMDIWCKIQLLIQQLLDYYLDISQISGQTASTGPATINYNLVSSLLPSAAVNMLFGVHSISIAPFASVSSGPLVSSNSIGSENYSSFFLKRRPMMVAGAMNAVNVMMTTGKNTLSASNVNQSSVNTDQQNVESAYATNSTNVGTSGSVTSSSTGTMGLHYQSTSNQNVLQTFSHSTLTQWRSTQSNLFKFDHSSQAISWNSFLQQQQQQRQTELSSQEDQNNNSESETDSNDTNLPGSKTNQSNNNINSRLFESLQSICHQSPDNLVLLYNNLLEHVNKCPVAEKNGDYTKPLGSLHSYLMASSEKFTQHINSQLDTMLEQALKSLESGVTILLSENQYGTQRLIWTKNFMTGNPESTFIRCNVLLESTVLVDVAIRDLNVLMTAMTDYRQHYLGYICNVLAAYKDACKRLYDSMSFEQMSSTSNWIHPVSSNLDIINQSSSSLTSTMNFANERRSILSAYWVRNEDINRLLKSQPNWIQLKIGKKPIAVQSPKIAKFQSRMMMINRQMSTSSSFDESPEDIRQRNASEIDIIMNLLSQDINRQELIWNDNQLTLLANMHQSFEWLSARCYDLVQLIQNQQTSCSPDQQRNDGSAMDPSEVYIATINQLSSDFEEISQLCLLILHLEIRLHCCYHLQALDAQFFTTAAPSTIVSNVGDQFLLSLNSNSQNLPINSDLSDDSRIVPLLEDIQRIYNEVAVAQLSSSKMNYLFEGLGHLMTTIFINSVMAVRRVKPNGIKRACRAIYDIQRRLTTITKSRELSLDYARQYFEMLLLTPDEILSSIIERGKQFKPHEYMTAITLLHQSGSGHCGLESSLDVSNQQLDCLLKRLNDILTGVTI